LQAEESVFARPVYRMLASASLSSKKQIPQMLDDACRKAV
jgi:hypothetical protein